jgi:hypothetical protein
MKTVLKLEELGMTIAALYLLSIYNLGLPVWAWALLFFAPDISMLGYAVNTTVGAFMYNLFHHKGIAVVLALCGYFLHNEMLVAVGALLFAHSSFDRLVGYGLKYSDDFKNTHLGRIGK